MYSAFDKEPVVWPSVEGMQHTVARFRSLPNIKQTRRMLNQESFVHERIHKLSTNVIKLKKENREKLMITLMHRILDGEHIIEPLSIMDLNDLGWVINMHLAEINHRIEAIKKVGGASPSTMAQPVTDDHQVAAKEVPVFHIPIVTGEASVSRAQHVFPLCRDLTITHDGVQAGGSNFGMVAPGVFNFEVGSSSNSGLDPTMFNCEVGASSNNVPSLSMFNNQGGPSGSEAVATRMLNFQAGAFNRGVVSPEMFNFQSGASSSSVAALDMFNFKGGPFTDCAVAPGMYNFLNGAFSNNATTEGMLKYHTGDSRNCVVSPCELNFDTGVSSNNTEALGKFNYKKQ
ncbi:hypothetical protein DM860_005874 [Cuscuta australis]|uniref:MADS-box domain-containing protein n=1 Tax=Cuscuta australis TaxID=267555 RepID=A0A328DT22_9ASTE|nr:hypothetical protein DM860_005874 [Cuscuta australis]